MNPTAQRLHHPMITGHKVQVGRLKSVTFDNLLHLENGTR